MQLVLSNNRVLAHGENFISFGGVVINTETGRRYDNATVAECDGCPSDIDKVGYEYHAGVFVPCAPFGTGNGNVVVACNEDCKALKDSGVPFGRMSQVVTTSYKGVGGDWLTLTFDAVPAILFFRGIKETTSGSSYDSGYAMPGVYLRTDGINGCTLNTCNAKDTAGFSIDVFVEGNTFTIYNDDGAMFNKDGYNYTVTAILQGGE